MKKSIPINTILQGDSLEVLKTLPDESIDMVITSPPYWALRDYGVEGQLGLEPTFQEYINKLCDIFDEVKRVLKKEGTCWVNLGDTYSGNSSYSKNGRQGYGNDKIANMKEYLDPKLPARKRGREQVNMDNIKSKSLCQIPSRFAIEMTNRGWILRNEIIWHKPNCMPSTVKDRFTVDFEKIFFFSKSKKYYFETQMEEALVGYKGTDFIPNSDKDKKSIKKTNATGASFNNRTDELQTKRNKRTVWTITTKPFREAHFAVFPPELVETPIKAGCPDGGIVLDLFFGAGTTGLVAKQLGKNYLGIELNPEYIKIAEQRLAPQTLL